MNRVIVSGGRRLSGEIVIGGSKNAALPLLFGGILTGEICVFQNLPRVSDVLRSLEILRSMGARIRFCDNGDVLVDYATVRAVCPPAALTGSIRGSTYLLGAMLGRFGRAMLRGAGGCDFGVRPIDQHLLGFRALGATVCEGETLLVEAKNGLCGTEISLAMPSVGATANLMLAAATADGVTVIRNAAAEPHVAALADFLVTAGAHIEGIGTDTVRVFGVSCLHGVRHRIIPDMIEAGTYLCAGAATGGEVSVCDVIPSHLGALVRVLRDMEIEVAEGGDHVTVRAFSSCRNVEVETGPYPAFPTDLHPQLVALFCANGQGVGVMHERIFLSRFRYVHGLRQMGADVSVMGETATVHPSPLHAARMTSPDLRGGAALLLAALATAGESEITNACTIGRGYEHLGDKLKTLGAHVRVI